MRALDQAIKIAAQAHSSQLDKLGQPYFGHCERVALPLVGDDSKTVAYLHDVVEKGPGWTLERLEGKGFSAEILGAVDAMTRRKNEGWEHFVRRAASNPLAMPVKEADLEDNLYQVKQLGGDATKYETGLAILKLLKS